MQESRLSASQRSRARIPSEEIANSITHGIGVALSVIAAVVLIVLAALQRDVWRIVSFSVYGGTLVLLYSSSTLYHLVQHPRAKRIFRILDHVSIYLLIAGTYTPFLLVALRGVWGWTLFGVIWGLALAGVWFKAFSSRRFRGLPLSTAMYLLMGWLSVIALPELLARVPLGGLIWLIAGGVMYTAGVVFFSWRKLRYHHAIWHLFVLAGSASHYIAVVVYLAPRG